MARALTENMTDMEILTAIAQDYADPANWVAYEKDFGTGRESVIPPWSNRDRGEHARRGLSIIKGRAKP